MRYFGKIHLKACQNTQRQTTVYKKGKHWMCFHKKKEFDGTFGFQSRRRVSSRQVSNTCYCQIKYFNDKNNRESLIRVFAKVVMKFILTLAIFTRGNRSQKSFDSAYIGNIAFLEVWGNIALHFSLKMFVLYMFNLKE